MRSLVNSMIRLYFLFNLHIKLKFVIVISYGTVLSPIVNKKCSGLSKGQSKMENNPETLVTLGTQDTGRIPENTKKIKYKTTKITKKMSNTDPGAREG